MNTAMNRKNPHLKSSGKEDKMIGFKDIYKMIGIIIVSFCAVFVCTLFLNYNLDLAGIKDQMAMEPLQSFYDALGFICAYLLMPKFYEMQNEKGLLPDIDIGFSPLLLFLLVILPACFFALLAVFYSYLKLKLPTLELLRAEKPLP